MQLSIIILSTGVQQIENEGLLLFCNPQFENVEFRNFDFFTPLNWIELTAEESNIQLLTKIFVMLSV